MLLPQTAERLALVESYGIAPAVAEAYVSEQFRGTLEQARDSIHHDAHTGYWSAMAVIALGSECRLLEETADEVREQAGKPLLTDAQVASYRAISRRLLTAYEHRVRR